MKMPVIFVGHGSPMNAISDNENTRTWQALGEQIKPRAILGISAHWYGRGVRVSDKNAKFTQIYDMYGFPEALYELQYTPKGDLSVANETFNALKPLKVFIDNTWGLDHGLWAVLCKMYPKANIPVVPMSVALDLPINTQFEIGKALKELRQQGVLILASGNIIHNLKLLSADLKSKGYEWALRSDEFIKKTVLARDYKALLHYQNSKDFDSRSFETLEHFLPFINAIGASDESDVITVFNQNYDYGAISMTGYVWGEKLNLTH